MTSKNLPEAEAIAMDILLVVDNNVFTIYCDADEILTCEEERCANELYNSCVESFVKGSEIKVVHIGYIRSGKIIVYSIDGKRVCLCVCRKGIDIISICNSYSQ